jgi:ectoine hydroxylase-related dioxygenase (phytanoyl-CoA dioxygenase family)
MKALTLDEQSELRRNFSENGYVIIRGVVPREKLSLLRAKVADEFEASKKSGELFSGGGSISGHLNCFPGEESRFAYEAVKDHGILDLVGAIVGASPGKLNVGGNLNLPGSATQHYHVDSSFLEGFMIVNVAVVDTDVVNGAIEVAPGTHRKFYKYWRFAVERPRGTQVPLNQGDVLIRTSNLWHRGMPNRSNAARPMLAFTFGDVRAPTREGDPFGVNDGKILFYPNWYRANLLGRLRERTFVSVPITYAAYRFARSLFGNRGYASY